MKNFFRIAAIFFAFGFAAAFAGCSNASGGGGAPAPSPAPTPTYTVTFNSNGGSDVTSQTVTSGQTATKPSDPSKDHFNFVEWCSDQACQTAFDFATPITDDITLYAKWSSLPVYVVTFVLNGGKYGSSDTYTQNVESGSKVARPSSNPAKDDTVSGDVTTKYAFENWYADAGCGTLFDFDATTISDPTTIYAKWSESIFYTVTFELNGGKYGASDTYTQSVLNGSKVTRPASNPTKDDSVSGDVTTKYTFDNWYADSGCGTLFDFNTMSISGLTTVYAKWNETKYYSVTIASGIEHGSVSSDATEYVAAGTLVTLTAAPNPGYDLSSYTVTDADSNTVTVVDGKFEMPANPVTVTATFSPIPLTFEAIEPDTVITFVNKASGSVTYRVNGGNSVWISSGNKGNVRLENIGDKVCFYGNNSTYCTGGGSSFISCSKDCYVYGNIMSLVDSENYENAKELTDISTFCRLFYENTHIKNKPGVDLALPATKLKNNCYESMFYGCTALERTPALPAMKLVWECYRGMFIGCTSLTSAPELPATELGYECYVKMFSGCTSLTSAPELPATTLAEGCYEFMFEGCTSLTSAPELPATTLANHCYGYMFSGCTSLTSPPELPATTLTEYCYGSMFSGCTSLTSAPVLPATTLAEQCYGGMFSGCTSLTSAPELPATTLAEGCYGSMFSGCTSLTSAPELPATTLATRCYGGMFSGCTSLTSAPELPATTLATRCYGSMFSGCTSLTSGPILRVSTLTERCYELMFYSCKSLENITCLATDISADKCVDQWVVGVSLNGTFTKSASMTKWTRDKNLPDKWTVVDYQE